GALAGLALVTAACGSDDNKDSTTDTTAAGKDKDASGDLAVAKLAASLEALAVDTYTKALSAATSGALGAVPPAVATFVTTAKGQHEEHLAAWNKVIKGAGEPEVTEPNATLAPVVAQKLGAAKTIGDAAVLALLLEQIAAQTYLSAIPTLKSKDAVKQAAQIQIVDQQHQAVLLFALGKYPVPEVFQKTDMAAKS
ncbi:MAG: ferritin-like domain-containing protein, partial [Acidimicrobiales bacterium]